VIWWNIIGIYNTDQIYQKFEIDLLWNVNYEKNNLYRNFIADSTYDVTYRMVLKNLNKILKIYGFG
jgi:hypothetical protein